jgi:hypothetical protein
MAPQPVTAAVGFESDGAQLGDRQQSGADTQQAADRLGGRIAERIVPARRDHRPARPNPIQKPHARGAPAAVMRNLEQQAAQTGGLGDQPGLARAVEIAGQESAETAVIHAEHDRGVVRRAPLPDRRRMKDPDMHARDPFIEARGDRMAGKAQASCRIDEGLQVALLAGGRVLKPCDPKVAEQGRYAADVVAVRMRGDDPIDAPHPVEP